MGYNTPKQTVSQFQLKDRYARQYLSFAGKSSKDFLLYLSGPGVYDSPAADVESTSVPGRNGDILTENAKAGRRRYQNVDIKYKAFFFNGLPAKTAAVKAWLLSPVGYQKLQDTYDPDFFRMAVCKDTDGSCLRDFGGKARSKILSDIRRGKRKMGADRVEQAPDFLEFEKGVYFAFIKEGIVDGDVITYTTNFGVKLTSTGNSRTLMAFIGFRRCNPNKTVEVLMDGWQVNGLCIRYHREKRKEKTAHTLMIRKRKAQERALLEQEA